MTSSYFSTPYSYPTNVQVHNPVSIYPVSALNEMQNHTIVIPNVSSRKTCRGVWLKMYLLVSIVFHLISGGLITWTLLIFYKTQREVWTKPVFEKGQPQSLSQKFPRTNSSSVICMTGKRVLFQGEFSRILAGKNEFFCRNIELSLELLAQEMLTAEKFSKKRKFSFHSYNVELSLLSGDKHDFETLPLIKVNDIYGKFITKIIIGNPGWFKIIVDLTKKAGRNVCTNRSKNFVRVTCEDPYLGRRTLLRKEWSCSAEIEERLIQPVKLGEIFKLSKGSILYVEVFNRTHLYKDVNSNYVGLVEI